MDIFEHIFEHSKILCMVKVIGACVCMGRSSGNEQTEQEEL